MGDSHHDPLRVDFDRTIKLEFHGSTVTSDAGLLAYRELDYALGLTGMAATGLHDTRTGQNTQHSLLALLRQSIYSLLAGYEDVNDAERLCLDPALRAVVGGRAKDAQAASTSEMARFETQTLSTKDNLKFLMDLPGRWIDQAHHHRKLKMLILDMDSSVSEAYGHQEGTAYNGHFGCTCYHPLFLFNQFGDLERVLLRRGNRGSGGGGGTGRSSVTTDCLFSHNQAIGGTALATATAIAATAFGGLGTGGGSGGLVKDSSFSNNQAIGGAAAANLAFSPKKYTLFTNAFAQGGDGAGGGLVLSGDSMGNAFNHNQAIGGAATANGAPANPTLNVVVYGAQAGSGDGGGIFTDSVASRIIGNAFTANQAIGGDTTVERGFFIPAAGGDGQGGAVCQFSSGKMTVTDSLFTGNQAVGGLGNSVVADDGGAGAGGGIFFSGDLTINTCELIGNQALGAAASASMLAAGGPASGGGIYSPGSGALIVNGSELIANQAVGGVGVATGPMRLNFGSGGSAGGVESIAIPYILGPWGLSPSPGVRLPRTWPLGVRAPPRGFPAKALAAVRLAGPLASTLRLLIPSRVD